MPIQAVMSERARESERERERELYKKGEGVL